MRGAGNSGKTGNALPNYVQRTKNPFSVWIPEPWHTEGNAGNQRTADAVARSPFPAFQTCWESLLRGETQDKYTLSLAFPCSP